MTSINSLKALNKATDTEQVSKKDIYAVHPDRLTEEPGFNTRGLGNENYFDLPHVKEHIRRLADAYKAGEQVDPLKVKVIDGTIYIRDGHCRNRAIKIAREEGAGITKVPVMEVQGDEINQTMTILTSRDGLDITPLERGATYQRLINYGLTPAQVAEKVRRSEQHVNQLVKMLEMPLTIKQMILARKVSAYAALDLYNEHGHAAVNILKEGEQEAARKGRDKVAPKDVKKTAKPKSPKIPRKLSTAVFDTFRHVSRLTEEAELDEENSMATIRIPIAQLARLQELGDEIAALDARNGASGDAS